MFVKGGGGDDGVTLAKVLASCGHKPSVASHEVLLRVSIRHVEGRDGVLLGEGQEIRLGLVCNWFEGCGVLGQCLMGACIGVTLQSAEGPELCLVCLLLLLALLKVRHGRLAYLGITGTVVVQLLRDVACSEEGVVTSGLWPANTCM